MEEKDEQLQNHLSKRQRGSLSSSQGGEIGLSYRDDEGGIKRMT